jgi:hypothetical protein
MYIYVCVSVCAHLRACTNIYRHVCLYNAYTIDVLSLSAASVATIVAGSWLQRDNMHAHVFQTWSIP